MQIHIETFTVHKRVPLTISRGTTSESTNLWVRVEQDGIEGWGEASPFLVGDVPQTTELLLQNLQALKPRLEKFTPFDRQPIERLLRTVTLFSAVRTAVDLALHDWIGKKVGLPLWQLWGLDRRKIVPTSVTIGISSPEAAKQRMLQWMDITTVKAVKVKLGSPAGVEADRAMLQAVKKVAPSDAKWSVDANGGWTVDEAIEMSHWLNDQGITYIEQPLAAGQEADLPQVYRRSPLPIFVDESCFTSRDIPALADRVNGINIKLMKSGGLTEALRMIHTAQACGLQVMFGCYSDSALSNTAAAQLAPLADHLDLDSHLNLKDDPFVGATMQEGCLIPSDAPGLGVIRA
ncbi:dipeptide epimerase [Leptolyngbya sp. FACHB-711]|uniref:dipeptide epimerase n=1 Tax=unclassified Leptolyngbya TaxID=2650499 RepID=UPI0016887C22|nr:dipeptide epimerase [Leptolyngbya sp. FACHB-711]MBD1848653.1 dipeptide epimerase [Cyanobacteria bacterium FACHB-502]MBD2024340.1 dipeptide epimerase [Leptolyngbya sp. FACHB-711]